MESLLDFLLMREPALRWVAIGVMLFSLSASAVGVFAFLRKQSLVGDAVSHSVLPGICLAYLLFESRNIGLLLAGAFATGWLSLVLIDLITRSSKIKSDTAIGLVLSVFFGTGLMLMTSIQRTAGGNRAGLDTFIFGSAASIIKSDVWVFAMLSTIIIASIVLLYRPLKLLSFDPAYTLSLGFPRRLLEILLATLTVLAVIQGIQTVGAVLMAAMLITPAATARYWTSELSSLLLIAMAVGLSCALLGAWISFSLSIPTGPVIIVLSSLCAIGSMLLAPERGILARRLRMRANRRKIRRENILKMFHHLGERQGPADAPRYLSELGSLRRMSPSDLNSGLSELVKAEFLHKSGDTWQLTESGIAESARIVRLHRLWELYLSNYLQIASDHVHDDAEAIEHVITPELEAQLLEALDYPETDPHGRPIGPVENTGE